MLSDDRLHYSTQDKTTLTDFSITYINCIDSSSLQEPCQALRQLVELAQHLLVYYHHMVTGMVIDYNSLK
jgi:hypothetical protein